MRTEAQFLCKGMQRSIQSILSQGRTLSWSRLHSLTGRLIESMSWQAKRKRFFKWASFLLIFRKERMSLWRWVELSLTVSTTSSYVTITTGLKWETVCTSSLMVCQNPGLPGRWKYFCLLWREGWCVVFLTWLPLLGCRIEKLWTQQGTTFFFGPIFIHPEETEHEPTKMFYKREVFLSNLEETLPMTCVIGTAPILHPTCSYAHTL